MTSINWEDRMWYTSSTSSDSYMYNTISPLSELREIKVELPDNPPKEEETVVEEQDIFFDPEELVL